MDKALFSYRADVPIGTTPDGQPVYASRVFLDYVAVQLFARVGGKVAMSNDELQNAIEAANNSPLAVVEHVPQTPEPDALISSLQAQVADLQQQINDLQNRTIA